MALILWIIAVVLVIAGIVTLVRVRFSSACCSSSSGCSSDRRREHLHLSPAHPSAPPGQDASRVARGVPTGRGRGPGYWSYHLTT